ncbi:hypothetical protein [Novosphingobium sp.]|uniref:hypothetical protein n=1 Tax=Novosphingobium sp. TaxID=1874826 RepID=UPI0025D45D33|nr:hypothetical protein [Novosphingobium sp.]
MMSDVAHVVMAEPWWTRAVMALAFAYALGSLTLLRVQIVGRDLRGFGARLRMRARLSLEKSGYIGALMARHTLLVTMNVLALNLSLNLLNAVRSASDAGTYGLLKQVLGWLAFTCAAEVIVIAAIILALCNAVIRLAEDNT